MSDPKDSSEGTSSSELDTTLGDAHGHPFLSKEKWPKEEHNGR